MHSRLLLLALKLEECYVCASQVNCKAAPNVKDVSRCLFNFTKLPYLPGLLLPIVDQAKPAAAQPYDLARARFGGRPVPQCAVLTEERVMEALDKGTPAAEAVATGAAAPLSTAPFCGMELTRNYTLTFKNVECGSAYAFTASATATTDVAGAVPVTADLSFDVTC